MTLSLSDGLISLSATLSRSLHAAQRVRQPSWHEALENSQNSRRRGRVPAPLTACVLASSFQPIFLNEVLVKLPTDPSSEEPVFHISHIDRVYTLRADNINERSVLAPWEPLGCLGGRLGTSLCLKPTPVPAQAPRTLCAQPLWPVPAQAAGRLMQPPPHTAPSPGQSHTPSL